MPIKIDCPQCKTHLRVPDKLAGQYVSCAHCKGKLLVSLDGGSAGGANANPPPTQSAGIPAPPVPTAGAAAPPAPRKKVARFIAAEPTDSTLRPADDGTLPELHLAERGEKEKTTSGAKSINPLLLLGALGVSVVMSLLLLVVDFSPTTEQGSETSAAMRRKIENNYFGESYPGGKELEPYQLLLREAQRAYTRGDYKAQRENYLEVLKMLRTGRGNQEQGLTGSRSRDKDLEEAISALLRGR